MLAIELNEKEREQFTSEFYSAWGREWDDEDDTSSPTPWGCPWYFGAVVELRGDTVKEMALHWFAETKTEIRGLLDEEKSIREEE